MGFLASLFGSQATRELLITDVTRMQGDRVCVAGIHKTQSVRLAEPQPTDQLLNTIGGVAVGEVVRLRWERLSRYQPPHSEDCRWWFSSLERLERLDSTRLYRQLAGSAFATVKQAFGATKYHTQRGNPAFPSGRGKRSLATLVARNIRVYRLGEKLRADFEDDDQQWVMFPVEGIALRSHFSDCRQCSRTHEARAELAVLRVGLGRPFQPDGEPPGCFAQINSVIPADPTNLHFTEEKQP